MLDSLPEYVRQAIEIRRGRIMCPKCDGGRSREESLSIRPLDDVLTKLSCWRSTCGWYAYVGTAGVKLQPRKIKEANVYRDPTMPVQGLTLRLLRQAYGLVDAVWGHHGWRMAKGRETLVMPVRDAYGRDRGHITRTMDTDKRCYTFKATSQPWLDWWLVNDHAPVVVVEDTLSACRLAGCGLNACALLGTSITTAQAREIAEVAATRHVYLALDNDAFVKSLNLTARHSHILRMDPTCLTVDIKNMDSDDDIRELFSGRNEFDRSDVCEQESA